MKRLPVLLVPAILLAACADSTVVGGSGGSGIVGKVLLGPMCPVEQAGSPCPDKPIQAEIVVKTADGKTAATGRSTADGSYRISLAPGTYTVVASAPKVGAGKPVTVEVPAGTFFHVNLLVDSGIR